MRLKPFAKLYLIVLPVFFALDMLWLGLLAKDFYDAQIGALLKADVNWTAAVVFYLVFIAGIVHFVLMPAVEKNSLKQAALNGAAFGFVTYATFDLTSLALIRDWPLAITLLDLAWGTVLTASVSSIAFALHRMGGKAA
ncbi:MAG: DUF2177 family protein [Xanthomonadaceae bacterium]|nr:DUF2177 family protein [Xanthomonadaceae bacterium]